MPTPPRRPARPQQPRPPVRTRRRSWALRVATTLSVVVLAAAGIGHAVVTGLDDEIARVDPFKDMKNRPEAGHGMNVLLVGTDGRDRITEKERRRYHLGGAPCHCTDTMMIVHISEDRERASIVSLPRDSYAETPEHTDRVTGKTHRSHPIKLNAAYAEGGPPLTVRTVEHMTKVKIDHYVEVDFTSFMRTVDVLGGVKICTARPLKDAYTGLDLPAGAHTLDGGQALQYVRSRYTDGSSDLGRMKRQQRFLASLMSQATSSGALLNPMRFRDITRAVLGSVRADKEFGTGELIDLGRALRGLTPASSEFTTVPISRMSHEVEGIGSTLKWDGTRSARLFEALRDDRPLSRFKVLEKRQPTEVEVAPEQIQVQVENGTTIPGLGKKVDGELAATGFATTRAPVNADDRDVRRTIVLYDPRWDRSAKSLATALPGSELRPVREQGPPLRVIAGRDFTKVRKVRAENPQRAGSEILRGDEVTCTS